MMAALIAGLGALAGVAATITAWLIYRPALRLRFARTTVNLSGDWHGWSVYVPVDGFFFGDREAIYRVELRFVQHGRVLRMSELITEIYDIHGSHLEHIAPRRFDGQGEVSENSDFTVHFAEQNAATYGTMMGAVDTVNMEVYAILCVRPRLGARPVAVKLLLRRVEDAMPDLATMNVEQLRKLII